MLGSAKSDATSTSRANLVRDLIPHASLLLARKESKRLPLRHELGDLEVPGELCAVAAAAPHARLAGRLAERRGRAAARRPVAVAGCDDGDPALFADLLVDHRAE